MYLKIQDLEDEGLREQIKPNAEKRITHGLIIGKISEAEDLDINPEDITTEFKTILDNHFGDDEKGRTEYMQSGDSISLLNRISSQVITRKTLDFLMAIAQGEDITDFLKKEDPEEIINQEGQIEEGEETSAEIKSEDGQETVEEKSDNGDQE